MTAVLWIVAIAAMVAGLVGVVLPLVPGVPLLFGGMLLAAWIDGFARVGVATVVVLAGLAAAAWLLDYVAAVWGAKRAGASGLAMFGAGLGAVVGLLGGLPGVIVGPIVGAIAGEYLARREARQAARAGVAAGLGFVVAAVTKVALAATMVGVFTVAYFA